MSRIDAALFKTGAAAPVAETRLARVAPRGTAAGGLREVRATITPLAVEPAQEREDAQDRTILSVGAVPAADLQPIAELGSEALIGELARIDLLVADRMEAPQGRDAGEAFVAGRAMIAEAIRRLRLVHGGHAALVLKA